MLCCCLQDTTPLTGDIDSGPLEDAAQEFRERVRSELEMFAIVSILLSAMAFAAFVTVPGALVMESDSGIASNNAQLLTNCTSTLGAADAASAAAINTISPWINCTIKTADGPGSNHKLRPRDSLYTGFL
jgi:hypothetical protein